MDVKGILLIDGSMQSCSVALIDEKGGILEAHTELTPNKQSERLAPMVHEVLEARGGLGEELSLAAIVVAEGPGSYTGLRIVAGYAKGLAYALGIPIYTVSTPQLMVDTALQHYPELGDAEETLLMPMIDARRMEIYTALYDSAGNPVSEIETLILTDEVVLNALQRRAEGKKLYYFGSGAEKAQELFGKFIPSSLYLPHLMPEAGTMATRAVHLWREGTPVDTMYWEPFYLKEYQAKVGENKVLAELLK